MAVHAKKEVKNLDNLVKIYSKAKKTKISKKSSSSEPKQTNEVKKIEVPKQDVIRDALIIAFIGLVCVIGYLLARFVNL